MADLEELAGLVEEDAKIREEMFKYLNENIHMFGPSKERDARKKFNMNLSSKGAKKEMLSLYLSEYNNKHPQEKAATINYVHHPKMEKALISAGIGTALSLSLAIAAAYQKNEDIKLILAGGVGVSFTLGMAGCMKYLYID